MKHITPPPANTAAPLIDAMLDHALLQALAPIEPPRRVKARMLKRLMARTAPVQAAATATARPRRTAEPTPVMDAPHQPVTIDAHLAPWKAFAPGIERQVLFRRAGTFAFLLRMQTGAVIPPHDHAHHEECLVVEGEIDIDGTIARAGDFHFAPQGVRHTPIQARMPSLLYLRTAV